MINEVWNTPKWKSVSQSDKQYINKLEDGYVSRNNGGFCIHSLTYEKYCKIFAFHLSFH